MADLQRKNAGGRSERQAIQRFNRHLDALLAGQPVEPGDLNEADRQALALAGRLEQANFSRQSRVYFDLRRKMRGGTRRRPVQPALHSLVIFITVFLVGWSLVHLVYRSSHVAYPAATAYRFPATSPSAPDSTLELAANAEAITPQPVPTPGAPRELVWMAPSGNNLPPTLISTSPTQSLGYPAAETTP
jgi:hypothetical protein